MLTRQERHVALVTTAAGHDGAGQSHFKGEMGSGPT
jgi:hypothetical protein